MKNPPISLLTAVAALVLAPFAGASQKQNVLFVMIDDLKPLLGCYGDANAITPNIDRLAERGVLFHNAHCQQAICGPSRASLLTGLRPDSTKVWNLQTKMRDVNPDILTMPQHFRNNGYETAGIGKVFDSRCVDNKIDKPSWSTPFYRNSRDYLDEVSIDQGGMWQDPEVVALAKEAKKLAASKGMNQSDANRFVRQTTQPTTECLDLPDNAYKDGAVTLHAQEILAELNEKEKPFFFAVGITKPHLPFTAPKKYWDLYDRQALPLAEFRAAAEGTPKIAYHISGEIRNYSDIPLERDRSVFGLVLPEEKQRELIHGYYAAVSYADALVGRLIKTLEELELSDNTVIVIAGDHGWHLGDHNLWCKHSNFEQATRTPLIIIPPKGKAQLTKTPVDFVDIFPTLCELTGLETPPQLEGTSLVPIMEGADKSGDRFAMSQYPQGKNVMGYSLRTERYRYTLWLDNSWRSTQPFDAEREVGAELYDYEKDPNETKNLVADPGSEAVLREVRGKMLNFFAAQVAN